MKKLTLAIQIETSRLILRPWRATDLDAFAQLNADAEVMQYFPKTLNREESDTLAHRIEKLITENGWGFFAIELKHSGEFIGFTGLHDQPEQFDFSPCVELGWRLAKEFWHQGYATEAAQACLNFAFQQLELDHVVAFTAKNNAPSEKVMQRLGMQYVKNFNHPALDKNHALAEHLLYRIQGQNP